MRWYPKTLKCQIFEDGQLVDLNTCSDPVLESLADSHYDLLENTCKFSGLV
jgi:hypothetical protein